MSSINLLYKNSYKINDNLSIYIPTVGEVVDNEDDYYSMVQMLTAMPIDLMVQLDDIGIDYTQISEYDLFMLMFNAVRGREKQYTRLIFGDLDLSKFELGVNESANMNVFIDTENDIVIDRFAQTQISAILRKIHHMEKNVRKPGNDEAKKYLLERARLKMKRNKNKHSSSQLEQLIVAMVNTDLYKYDYEQTRGLSIYQFNESVKQIIKKTDYEHKMHGVYAGTISTKDLSQDDLNWLTHKD